MKKQYNLYLLLTFITLLFACGLNGADPLFTILDTGKDFTDLEFNLSGYDIIPVEIEGVTYYRILHPEAGFIMYEGLPELLSFSVLLAVPATGTVEAEELSIISKKSIEDILLFPSQGYDLEVSEKKGVLIDNSFYEKDHIYSFPLVQVGTPSIMRDLRIVTVSINPFQYNPFTQELIIKDKISFRVNYQQNLQGENEILEPNRKLSRSFEHLYQNHLINYEQFRNPTRQYQARSILVIYNSSTTITALVNNFVEWKREKGFEITATSTANLSSNTAIKNYIQTAYNTWQNPPEYVIIIGGKSGTLGVPLFTVYDSLGDFGGNSDGDHPYTLLAGNDDLADVFIGRIAAANSDQLATSLSKIYRYEKEPYLDDTDWYEHNTLVGDPGSSGVSTIYTNRYVKDIMQRHNNNYSFTEIYSGSFSTQMNNAINQGTSFLSYRGFENVSGWSPTDTNLYNGYKMPNVTVYTCRTLNFSGSKQVDRVFHLGTPTTGRGAVSGIGMTWITNTAFNNCLIGGTYYSIFVGGARTMGNALVGAKLELWRVYSNSHTGQAKRYFHMVNLLGDPSMDIWVEMPKEMNVAYNTTLPLGTNSIQFSVTDNLGEPVEGAWVTIRQGNDNIFKTAYTDDSGIVTHLFSPSSTGTVTVTVTKQDHLPHRGNFSITGAAAVSYHNSVINGELVAGNEVSLVIQAKNHSQAVVNGVTGVLTTDSDYIEILNAESTFGNIAAGGIVNGNDSFIISLANSVPSGYTALFELILTDSANNSWISRFVLNIQNADLEPISFTIGDNGNGILDPNEQADIIVSVRNNSNISLQNVSATISGSNYGLSITDNSAFFGNIAAGQTVTSTDNHFRVSVGAFVIPGTTFELQLHLFNEAGFSQHKSITIPIGQVSVTTPLGPDNYGYWAYDIGDTNYEEAPVYSWIEIAPNLGGAGTNTGIATDYNNNQQVTTMNLPFTFQFYGEEYNRISICGNGWISFEEVLYAEQRNWRLPGPLGPPSMVAAFWDNLRISGTGSGIFTHYNNNENIFIIQWNALQNVMGNAPETFQIILFDPAHHFTRTGDGKIKIQYKTFNNVNNGVNSPSGIGNWGNYCTVGISDPTCTDGLEYTFNNRYPTAARTLSNESAILFTTGSSTAIISIDEYSFTDGNNNIPESGETIDINLSLINTGNVNAEAITAYLSSNDQFVSILEDGEAEFGDIDSEESVFVESAFRVTIAPDTPHLHQIELNIEMISAENQNWTGTITMEIRSPNIDIDSVVVTDDNNNIPEFNETVSIEVALTNSGESIAENISAFLSSNDPFVIVLNGETEYGDIEPQQIVSGTTPFSVEFADNIPHQHRVNFILSVYGGEGQQWDRSFYIDVNAPKLFTGEPFIYDPAPGGNGNGLIDPDESFIIYLPVKNIGGATSPEVNINISSNIPQVTITAFDNQLSSIAVGETHYPAVYVTANDQLSTGNEVIFNYTYQTGNYTFEGEFNKYVGGAVNAQIGSGVSETDVNEANPVNIYYRSLRGQMVYTADELTQAGAIPGLPIIQFGFYITQSPLHPLPNFTIRMKHTTAANAASHDEGPFETVFQTAQYIPTEGRWDTINLNTSFLWNGVDNILVDTAFSQTTSWDGSGKLRINNMSNGFRYVRSDSASQINVPTNLIAAYRPQAVFVMGSDPDANTNVPTNLTAEPVDNNIFLSWQAPVEVRNERNSRRNSSIRDSSFSREPDSYNIYRNGIRINENIVTETQYTDNTIENAASYYYHITAIYGETETPPSNIALIEILAVSAPIINPPAGIYHESFTVTITCETENALIYYTLNGEEPSQNSFLYEDGIQITQETVLKAKAFHSSLFPSETVTANYYMLFPPSNLTGIGGIDSVQLNWDEPEAEQIDYYRTTRTRLHNQRNSSSRELIGYNIYRAMNQGQFNLVNQTPVQNNYYLDTALIQGVYNYFVNAVYSVGESQSSNTITIRVGNVVENPVFSPNPGSYAETVAVTISSETTGASIHYTLNGLNPTIYSPMFTGTPLSIAETTTIKAIAVRTNWLSSEIVTAVYTIEPVSAEDESLPARKTELFDAFPNPFNPETKLSFALKDECRVKIDIYNIKGTKVRTLIDEVITYGEHNLIWNGKDNFGNQVGSGIYFYQMSTKDYRAVKKLILLK